MYTTIEHIHSQVTDLIHFFVSIPNADNSNKDSISTTLTVHKNSLKYSRYTIPGTESIQSMAKSWSVQSYKIFMPWSFQTCGTVCVSSSINYLLWENLKYNLMLYLALKCSHDTYI